MRMYRHHTAVDVIDLDDETGHWVALEKNKDGPIRVGQMPMAMRADGDIRGSYAIESETRYYFYWNGQSELIFRTGEERFCLFRREADGGLEDLAPGLVVDLRPASDGPGRGNPGESLFSLAEPDSGRCVKVRYDAGRYLQYYLGNFTYVPDEDLSDWDFFVYVKYTVEELKLLARARALGLTSGASEFVQSDKLLVVRTGEAAGRAGLWAAAHHLDRRCWLERDETAPDVDGRHETWVWLDA